MKDDYDYLTYDGFPGAVPLLQFFDEVTIADLGFEGYRGAFFKIAS